MYPGIQSLRERSGRGARSNKGCGNAPVKSGRLSLIGAAVSAASRSSERKAFAQAMAELKDMGVRRPLKSEHGCPKRQPHATVNASTFRKSNTKDGG